MANKHIKLTESNGDLDFQLDVVSEALDQLVEMYNSDVCKLSKKLMTSKFGDKITPDIKERLTKANHPKDVYAIHEELALGKPLELSQRLYVADNPKD